MSFSPIAVLDTGAGGLSVVKAIRQVLPKEDIYYFADTAHLPYGIKSPELIRHLAIKFVKTAIDYSSCKMVIIACHTISVICLKEIEDAIQIPVIGMVKPSLQGLQNLFREKTLRSLGILSTEATLKSGIYSRAWPDINQGSKLFHQACGALVSLVEESDFTIEEQKVILAHFLSDDIKQCDALLLGCTHFNALIPALRTIVKSDCHIIDAAEFVAYALAFALENSNQLASKEKGHLKVYVTDNPERFKKIAYRFMSEDLFINHIKNYVASSGGK